MDIKLTSIKESPHNARRTFDETKLKELAASIKEKGLLQAIIVRPSNGKYEIVCGARRFRAAKLAGLTEIKVEVQQLNDKQVLEYQVIENLQREDVHPLEEAEGYEQLMKKHGYKDVKDIAAKVGKSPTYIYGRLKLCDLIPENRKLFYDGKFSPSVALLVARVPAHLQKEAGKRIVRGENQNNDPMSYREAQEFIHEDFMLRLKEVQFDLKEKGLANKPSCAECPKRTGNQKELFPDVSSADVCTDLGCFEAKKNAFAQRTIDRLKAQRKTVISHDEAKRLFRYETSDTPEQKYMSLDESHYFGGKYRKLRDIAKASKDLKTIFAIQPFSTKIIEMVDKKDLPGILKKAGIKEASISSPGYDRSAEMRKENLRRAIVNKIALAVNQKISEDKKLSFLRLLAENTLAHCCHDERNAFIKRHDPKIKSSGADEACGKYLAALKEGELVPFCMEILCAGSAISSYGQRYGNWPTLCKHYNIDIKKIETQVTAEFKAKKPKGKVPKELVK